MGRAAGGSPAPNGFTLIELMIALLLFALISVAGVSLVETVIGVQHRTAGRAARLAALQRAMFLIDADFEQLTAGPTQTGPAVALERAGGDGDHRIVYRLAGTALHRAIDGQDRELLQGISALTWRFYKPGQGWLSTPGTREDPSRPRGVELAITMTPQPGTTNGPLRRVIALPAEPPR